LATLRRYHYFRPGELWAPFFDCRALALDITLCCTLQSLQLQILSVCLSVCPLYLQLHGHSNRNAWSERPTNRIWRTKSTDAKPVIKLSEINRRCRSVLSVDFGSAMDYSVMAITMRARKLRTCQLGMSRWSVGRWPTSAGKKRRFTRVRRHLGQTPSDLCQELLGADTHGSKCFQCHSKKVVGAAEWDVLVPFSESCSLSGTGTGDDTLMQISVSRSVDHCDVKWRCAQSSMAGMSNRQVACWRSCRRHGPARVVPSCWERRLESKRARLQQCCRRLTRLSSVVVCRPL